LIKLLSLLEVFWLSRKTKFFLSPTTLQPNKSHWDATYF